MARGRSSCSCRNIWLRSSCRQKRKRSVPAAVRRSDGRVVPFPFGLNELVLPDRCNRRFQVGDVKEEHCLVFGGVRLSPLSLKANKISTAVEFRIVPELPIRNCKTERFLVKLLCPLQIVKVQFNTDESSVDGLH